MANLRAFAAELKLLNFSSLTRCNGTNIIRHYSVFPKHYVEPVVSLEQQEAIKGTEQEKELLHVPIKPARHFITSSEFYDEICRKLTNYIMRKGNKTLALQLFQKTVEHIKLMQLERYHKAAPEEKAEIELRPKVLIHRAVENCKPILQLSKVRKGGISYQVPVPLHDNKSTFLAMNWLVEAAKNTEKKNAFAETLAAEILDAANNEGRIVRKKQELHKLCEANRAYAHFRWQ